MTKYSFEFKLKVVNDYLSGKGGYRFLSSKYSLPHNKMVFDWANAYKEFGELGLQRKRKKAVYDFNFKLSAVNLYLTSEWSYREVANHLNINNHTLIVRWVKEYRQNGDCFSVPKSQRRPREEISVPQEKVKKSSKKLTELEQQLAETQKELLYLRVENEYLKGLRRLRMERQTRKNPDLFKASKDSLSSLSKSSSKPHY